MYEFVTIRLVNFILNICMKKSLKRIILLGLILFFGYLVYLNHLVKGAFSSEIQESNNITRIENSLETYPTEMVNMLLLVEDQSFFQHWGVDFKEIVRVFYGYLFEDKAIRGASTITQHRSSMPTYLGGRSGFETTMGID